MHDTVMHTGGNRSTRLLFLMLSAVVLGVFCISIPPALAGGGGDSGGGGGDDDGGYGGSNRSSRMTVTSDVYGNRERTTYSTRSFTTNLGGPRGSYWDRAIEVTVRETCHQCAPDRSPGSREGHGGRDGGRDGGSNRCPCGEDWQERGKDSELRFVGCFPCPSAPPPPPSCTLSLDPASIIETQSAELSWTTSRADTLTINQGIGSVTPVSGGSVTVSPTRTTTYTGTVSGSTGTANCSAAPGTTPGNGSGESGGNGSGGNGVVLSVTPLPEPEISSSPRFSQTGGQCTLDWTVSNTTDTLTCTLTGQGTTLGSCTGAECASGRASSDPLQGKTAFTLTCTDTVENLGPLTDEAECFTVPDFEEF